MPEPTRQSLCCSQPEHGPTLATKCHRQGKRTWPDRDSNPGSLAYRASSLTAELPSHTISPLHILLDEARHCMCTSLILFKHLAQMTHKAGNYTFYINLLENTGTIWTQHAQFSIQSVTITKLLGNFSRRLTR